MVDCVAVERETRWDGDKYIIQCTRFIYVGVIEAVYEYLVAYNIESCLYHS